MGDFIFWTVMAVYLAVLLSLFMWAWADRMAERHRRQVEAELRHRIRQERILRGEGGETP